MPEETVEQIVTEPVPTAQETPPEAKLEEGKEPEATAQQEARQPETDKPRDEKGQFKSPVQDRIDELTRARREAEREAAYWRQRAQPAEEPVAPKAKPSADQFKDYGEYVEALADWKADQKVSEALKARDNETAQSAAQRVQETKAQTFVERQAAAKTSIPDYDAVVGAADVPIAPHLGEAILDSDKGPELVYHLAKNPAEAARLSAMSPLAAARELGRIEATLGQQAAPAKPVTKAPAPMKPTAGGGTSATTDPSRMSHEEYRAWRAKQGARWA
jgi:hypothetical protein